MSLNCDSQQLQWRAPAVDSDYAAFGHMILLFFFFVIVTNYRALENKPVLLQDTPAQFDVANLVRTSNRVRQTAIGRNVCQSPVFKREVTIRQGQVNNAPGLARSPLTA